MSFRNGDRVRITSPNSEYTGCRGTIMEVPGDQPADIDVLGHAVAIDGENGRTRAFLLTDLEPLRAVRVRGQAQLVRLDEGEGGSLGD